MAKTRRYSLARYALPVLANGFMRHIVIRTAEASMKKQEEVASLGACRMH